MIYAYNPTENTSRSNVLQESKNYNIIDLWKSYNGIDDDGDGVIDFSNEDWDEGVYTIETELINETTSFKIFIDTAITISKSKIDEMSEEINYDLQVATNSFGLLPDVNNDHKVSIVVTDIRDENYYGMTEIFTEGFFWTVQSKSFTTNGITQFSHNEEIIYLDYLTINLGHASEIVSHELQHLIQYNYHNNPEQDLWLDEGFSVLSEDICGYNNPIYYTEYFFDNPYKKSLTYFENDLESYGLSYLFVKYLIGQYGSNIVQKIIKSSEIGINAIIETLHSNIDSSINIYSLLSNFTSSLVLNNNEFRIPTATRVINPHEIAINNELDGKVFSWGFNPYILMKPTSKYLKIDFEGDFFDTRNYANNWWITILRKNGNKNAVYLNMIDPISAKAEFLFPYKFINDSQVYIFINSYAGVSGGSNPLSPPYSNFTIKTTTHEGSFNFPGYIHIKDNYLLITSIRAYDNNCVEWNPTTAEISQYQIVSIKNDEVLYQGNLVYTDSGWMVPNVNLNEIDNHQDYKVKYILYNGDFTLTFESESFSKSDIGNNNINDILDGIFNSLLLIPIVITSIFFIRKIRKRDVYTRKNGTIRLTKLDPLFSKTEKSKFQLPKRGKKFK